MKQEKTDNESINKIRDIIYNIKNEKILKRKLELIQSNKNVFDDLEQILNNQELINNKSIFLYHVIKMYCDNVLYYKSIFYDQDIAEDAIFNMIMNGKIKNRLIYENFFNVISFDFIEKFISNQFGDGYFFVNLVKFLKKSNFTDKEIKVMISSIIKNYSNDIIEDISKLLADLELPKDLIELKKQKYKDKEYIKYLWNYIKKFEKDEIKSGYYIFLSEEYYIQAFQKYYTGDKSYEKIVYNGIELLRINKFKEKTKKQLESILTLNNIDIEEKRNQNTDYNTAKKLLKKALLGKSIIKKDEDSIIEIKSVIRLFICKRMEQFGIKKVRGILWT